MWRVHPYCQSFRTFLGKFLHPKTHRGGLRTRVSRQVEDQSGEKREQHAGNDDVDDEIERQPQHQEVVGDVQVRRVGTAGVVNPVFPAPVVLQHPFTRLHEVTEVGPIAVLKDRRVGNDAQSVII